MSREQSRHNKLRPAHVTSSLLLVGIMYIRQSLQYVLIVCAWGTKTQHIKIHSISSRTDLLWFVLDAEDA